MKLQDFVDKGVYINLPHRVDKRDAMSLQLQKLCLDNFIQRVDGVYPKDLGFEPKNNEKYEIVEYSTAAANAHLNVVRTAKEKNYKNILVLEDDVEFTENGIAYLTQALEQLNKIENWNILYIGADLGYNTNSYLELHGENLVKTNNATCSHAYILNSNCFNFFLNYPNITHFDIVMNALPEKYVVYPLAIIQRHINKTDIGETDFTCNRSFWEKSFIGKTIVKKYE